MEASKPLEPAVSVTADEPDQNKEKENSSDQSTVAAGDASGDEDASFSLPWREKLVITSLMIISWFTSLEATAIGPPIPIIAKAVNATSVQAVWIGTSYFLGSAIIQPLGASYSHIFGRRPITLLALFLFLVGTIVCSVSHNAAGLLAGRTIQGIGSGGCIAMVDIIISDLIPLRQRAAYFGLVSLSWAFGTSIGPLMGAAFSQEVTWRWIFWVLIPFNTVAMVIVATCLRLQRREERALAHKLREVDVVGSLLFVASCTSFLIAISWGGVQFPWRSWHTLVPLILGVAGLAGFAAWEQYGAELPLLPLRVFGTRTSAQGFLGITTTGMVMWAVLYYLPFYFEGVLGYSFIISSVGLLPLTLVVSPSAVVTGVLITVTGRYRVFLWSGWVVTVLGFGLMIKLGLGTSIAQWIFLTLPGGLGTGMILSSMQIAVQAASRDEDVAVTVAMVPELRTFGQALGLAIFGSVFSNTVRSKLGDIPSSLADPSLVARLGSDPIQLVEVIRHTADGPLKEELKRAMWLSTRAVWIAGLGFYAVSAIASLAARHYDLNKVLSSEHKVKKEKPATEAI